MILLACKGQKSRLTFFVRKSVQYIAIIVQQFSWQGGDKRAAWFSMGWMNLFVPVGFSWSCIYIVIHIRLPNFFCQRLIPAYYWKLHFNAEIFVYRTRTIPWPNIINRTSSFIRNRSRVSLQIIFHRSEWLQIGWNLGQISWILVETSCRSFIKCNIETINLIQRWGTYTKICIIVRVNGGSESHVFTPFAWSLWVGEGFLVWDNWTFLNCKFVDVKWTKTLWFLNRKLVKSWYNCSSTSVMYYRHVGVCIRCKRTVGYTAFINVNMVQFRCS